MAHDPEINDFITNSEFIKVINNAKCNKAPLYDAFGKLPSIYVFSYFPFGFEGRMWDLIVSVSDHCLSFYFPVDVLKNKSAIQFLLRLFNITCFQTGKVLGQWFDMY